MPYSFSKPIDSYVHHIVWESFTAVIDVYSKLTLEYIALWAWDRENVMGALNVWCDLWHCVSAHVCVGQTVPYAFAWTTLLEGTDIPFQSLAVRAPSERSSPHSASSCARIGLSKNRSGISDKSSRGKETR